VFTIEKYSRRAEAFQVRRAWGEVIWVGFVAEFADDGTNQVRRCLIRDQAPAVESTLRQGVTETHVLNE
jgi:hypothetical protein